MLKEAVEIYTPYATETKFVTVPSASRIDMTKYGASEIEEVYESPQGVRDIEFNPLAVLVNATKLNFKEFAIRQATLSEIGAQTRKHFQFHEGYLYLDGFVGNVTIEYFPIFEYNTSDDEVAISWIGRYTQALCKELVGRIRSKFTPNNLPVEFDGSTLLAEAASEKESLMNEITEKGLGHISMRR